MEIIHDKEMWKMFFFFYLFGDYFFFNDGSSPAFGLDFFDLFRYKKKLINTRMIHLFKINVDKWHIGTNVIRNSNSIILCFIIQVYLLKKNK